MLIFKETKRDIIYSFQYYKQKKSSFPEFDSSSMSCLSAGCSIAWIIITKAFFNLFLYFYFQIKLEYCFVTNNKNYQE